MQILKNIVPELSKKLDIETFVDSWIEKIIIIFILILFTFIFERLIKFFLFRKIHSIVTKTKNTWDDYLFKKKLIHHLINFFPLVFIYIGLTFVFINFAIILDLLHKAFISYLIIKVTRILQILLTTFNEIYESKSISRQRPIKGYLQSLTIFIYFVSIVLILSILFNKDPSYFLTSLGALTAILLIVFKDSILGFVASVQMTVNNMVNIGDWIEFPKYGADGDVIDVTLTTVKVQNWDKTISFIPPYAFVADSFRNWRSMFESGGRRIKRSIYLDVHSVRFLDQKGFNRLKKIDILQDYLTKKKQEIDSANQRQETKTLKNKEINSQRKITNIGTFRAYLKLYLKQHPLINDKMTFLVRQLQATEKGLPLEIYVFCNNTEWTHYEAIQADIFDHIFAVLPIFNLRIFQDLSSLS